MPRYRIKGGGVQAVQWGPDAARKVIELNEYRVALYEGRSGSLMIGQVCGLPAKVRIGDWVVAAPGQRLQVMTDKKFRQKYEEVPDDDRGVGDRQADC